MSVSSLFFFFFFFFQAEDGIRDKLVTGVQTCALPIWSLAYRSGGVPGSQRPQREVTRAPLPAVSPGGPGLRPRRAATRCRVMSWRAWSLLRWRIVPINLHDVCPSARYDRCRQYVKTVTTV